jgi:hypothetical protein
LSNKYPFSRNRIKYQSSGKIKFTGNEEFYQIEEIYQIQLKEGFSGNINKRPDI